MGTYVGNELNNTATAVPFNKAWTAYGNGRNDSLTGGTANDVIYGDYSDLVRPLFPRYGNDTLRGGNGRDRIYGDLGNDALYGDAGRDRLYGGGGQDTLSGGVDDDYLDGGEDNDRLNGGNGDDRLDGGLGADTLIGANADSSTPGKGEVDTLTGGEGKDTFVLGARGRVFYNDGIASPAFRPFVHPASGTADYALITDFVKGQDTIQLKGDFSDYILQTGSFTGGSASDTRILLRKPFGEVNEVIGVVQDVTGLHANNFTFVS